MTPKPTLRREGHKIRMSFYGTTLDEARSLALRFKARLKPHLPKSGAIWIPKMIDAEVNGSFEVKLTATLPPGEHPQWERQLELAFSGRPNLYVVK